MAGWVPKNYKEFLIRQAEELLRLCEVLNGGEIQDGFAGDKVRFHQNIAPQISVIQNLVYSASRIDFDKLSAPIELTP